ncbi:hypothetical protein BHE90_016224 [Fusarium euwallaceae]|uniref:Uncharacterized protein n=1 Tax=Fusarium euwallaceae TaxID=1147111 RepID=A0A430L123_9HYPO|nr:hypothetical protein BHE90_016224 [Fusarium euwallaceae]
MQYHPSSTLLDHDAFPRDWRGGRSHWILDDPFLGSCEKEANRLYMDVLFLPRFRYARYSGQLSWLWSGTVQLLQY